MKKTLLAIILATAATSASADSWLYAGLNYGQADSSVNGASSDNAYGLNVGTGILPFIGVEAGYWDLGSGNGVDYSTWYLAAKPSINLGDFEVYGKLGINRFETNGGYNRNGSDGYDLMYGVGVEYTIIDNIPMGSISAGVAYNRFNFDAFEVDTYSLSLTAHFL